MGRKVDVNFQFHICNSTLICDRGEVPEKNLGRYNFKNYIPPVQILNYRVVLWKIEPVNGGSGVMLLRKFLGF